MGVTGISDILHLMNNNAEFSELTCSHKCPTHVHVEHFQDCFLQGPEQSTQCDNICCPLFKITLPHNLLLAVRAALPFLNSELFRPPPPAPQEKKQVSSNMFPIFACVWVTLNLSVKLGYFEKCSNQKYFCTDRMCVYRMCRAFRIWMQTSETLFCCPAYTFWFKELPHSFVTFLKIELEQQSLASA